MKVKRTKYMYKNKSPWKKVLLILLLAAALFGVGWLISGPVGDWLAGISASSAVSSAAASSVPQSSAPAVSADSSAVSGAESVTSQPVSSQISGIPANAAAICPGSALLHDSSALAAYCDTAVEKGVNTVVIDVKNTEGYLLYSDVGTDRATGTPHEIYSKISEKGGTDPAYIPLKDLTQIVEIIKSRGLTAVARINCLMDSYGGNAIKGAKLTLDSGKTTWLDDSKANGGKSWLNPYASVVSDYTLTIANDCAYFGFNAIILDFVQYPVGFSTDRINYGEEAVGIGKKEGLENFINKICAVDLPVYLTVRNSTAEGSVEFAGSPFAYETDVEGYIVIVNAPVSARKLAPAAVSGELTPVSYATEKRVITAVLAKNYDSAPYGLSEYMQLEY